MRGGIVGRRIPVCGPDETRTDHGAARGRLSTRKDWAASRIDSLRPIQLLYEGNRGEKSSVGPVEDIQETIAVGLHQHFSRLALVDEVQQNGGFRGIKIEEIMGGDLEIPLEFSGIWGGR